LINKLLASSKLERQDSDELYDISESNRESSPVRKASKREMIKIKEVKTEVVNKLSKMNKSKKNMVSRVEALKNYKIASTHQKRLEGLSLKVIGNLSNLNNSNNMGNSGRINSGRNTILGSITSREKSI